ncbi:DUF438 domain-containing protein [Desemzia incerta]|uniref:DUF438 domain-containing protein n=1 Tax=Desemzia incerta TaxID=82801 RepID=UPI00166066CB|nr:DUF438 domain-containing protein [Desemzia incerta]
MTETQHKGKRALELEQRQSILKDLLLRLHAGADKDLVKQDFEEHFSGISAFEISVMERRLLGEGINVEDIQKLCNIHASMFLGAISDPENQSDEFKKPGHPIHVLKQENLAIESSLNRIQRLIEVYLLEPEPEIKDGLLKQLTILWQFDNHYARKENSMFPIMERYGITAPPKVMWGVDDDIRALFKQVVLSVETNQLDQLKEEFATLKYELEEMIVKEEEILIPMVSDIFNEDDWLKIEEESDEIGYCIVKPEAKWIPERTSFEDVSIPETEPAEQDANIHFKVGHLTPNELEKMLNLLPLELSFVDANDTVKYFNVGTGRKLFPRTKNAIGRQVENCHPPKSQPIVKKLIEDFKSGEKDSETLWFHARGEFVMVTYTAVRDDDGTYMGTLEYVQPIQNIIDLDGTEKKSVE